MTATVRLQDIVDALEMMLDEYYSFLDLDTGEVETIPVNLLHSAEEWAVDPANFKEPYLPGWQKPQWEVAKRIFTTDRMVKLPTKFEVHEWQIMREFVDSLDAGPARHELLDAIHGRGAFRSFNAAIHRRHIEKAWYAFRTEALREIAIDWCEERQIAWRPD